MRTRIGFDIGLEFARATPVVARLNVRPSRIPDLLSPDDLMIEPCLDQETFLDEFGNRCVRLDAPAGLPHFKTDAIIADTGEHDRVAPEAGEIPVTKLPAQVLRYLTGSRYCETDLLSQAAWEMFGATRPGWERVQAVVDFVHSHLKFGYPQARPTRTATEAYAEQLGVCRDFAHLAMTFCRCLNIPARYATGYLGDIGVPRDLAPMDFSAWFEVFLEGGWHTFDARHNQPRIGRIVMAYGRDAADVPLTHTFGPHRLTAFKVWTDEAR